jgi:hypothetical protein
MDPVPAPAIFVSDFQEVNNKKNFPKFFCLLLFEGLSLFQDKKSYRSHKTVGINVSLTIFA